MRTFFALYMTIVLIYSFITQWRSVRQVITWWDFYTNLSFISLCIYFIVLFPFVLITQAAAAMSYRHLKTPTYPSLNPHYIRHTLLWLYYHQIMVSGLTVPLIYWTLIFPAGGVDEIHSPADYWTTTSKHGIQLVFILCEVFLNEMVMHWVYVPHTWIVLGFYVALTAIRNQLYVYFLWGDVGMGIGRIRS